VNTSVPSLQTAPIPQPLARRTKVAWATGAIADVFMVNAFSYLALPIYNVALKVDPAFLGWAMGIPRIWDAVADYFIGSNSDNARSRWGRRRPFIDAFRWGSASASVLRSGQSRNADVSAFRFLKIPLSLPMLVSWKVGEMVLPCVAR
jgi:hypothetical protein